ncbi:hypothetical protein [Phaeodactylibacter luteus]|uniref:Uncharacterized protein n=1 Tax=Phaeodactylibacter luteus TaxID=1564516 RepID=A0A5C6RM37_9BACT|nr:hypothetical protein [Phaeodactylibacter luteus]TXB63461.1 hypothetical protein FRY97_08880 [Phaeodactylibacter luteus]
MEYPTDKEKNSEKAKKISRQEALHKLGKYAAATAAGTFLILSPKQAQASSTAPSPGGDPFGGAGRPGGPLSPSAEEYLENSSRWGAKGGVGKGSRIFRERARLRPKQSRIWDRSGREDRSR